MIKMHAAATIYCVNFIKTFLLVKNILGAILAHFYKNAYRAQGGPLCLLIFLLEKTFFSVSINCVSKMSKKKGKTP
jgi:membrane glycosyltransferase